MAHVSVRELMTSEPRTIDPMTSRQPRYEDFSLRERSFVFTDSVGLGKRCTCTVTRGDVNESLYKHYLRVELPRLDDLTVYDTTGSPALEFSWVEDLGFSLIESVELSLNDNIVEKHTGEWLSVRSTCGMSSDALNEVRRMIRSVPDYGQDNRGKDKIVLCVPLFFFFGKSVRDALPLLSTMDKSTVKFMFKFRSLWELVSPRPIEGSGSVITRGVGHGINEVLWTQEDMLNQLQLGDLSTKERLPLIMNSIDQSGAHKKFDILQSSVDCVMAMSHPTRTLRLKNAGWRKVVERIVTVDETISVNVGRTSTREVHVSLPFTASVSEILWVFRRENSNAFNRFTDWSEDVLEAGLMEAGNEVVRQASIRERGSRICLESSGKGSGTSDRIGRMRFADDPDRDYMGMKDLSNPRLVLQMRGGSYTGRLIVFVVSMCRAKWGDDGSFFIENTVRVTKKKSNGY